MTRANAIVASVALALAASAGSAQVVINEVYENPPGSGGAADDRLEYIELYGKPGMSLNGYILACVKGGADPDGDGIPNRPPDLDSGDEIPEIDECFCLDGYSIGANGFFVLYNDTGSSSFIPGMLPAGTANAGFEAAHCNAPDTPGRLRNDGSSTYILLRCADANPHNVNMPGVGIVVADNYWHKDTVPDVDFDGKIDFGFETTLPPIVDAVVPLEAYQMGDNVAWSNAGGKEYVRSSEDEISDTPSFNPDAISRVAYYGSNPMLGSRFNSSGALVETRKADEEWIYGDMDPTPILVQDRLDYDAAETKGPTDPNGPGYDGSCNPDAGACAPNGGPFLFDDIDVSGFRMTPGGFNDGGTAGITQFRWIDGDLTFDGAVTSADFVAALNLQGAGIDDTMTCLDPMEQPYTCKKFEGAALQSLFVALCQDETDGEGGANADVVTQDDIDALGAIVCPGDVTTTGTATGQPGFGEPDGVVDLADLLFYVNVWDADLGPNPGSPADVTTTGAGQGSEGFGASDGNVDLADLLFFVNLWNAGLGYCPA